jgi:hypothetical protein
MDQSTATRIVETFSNADLTIIKEVIFFDGWMTYEECGGYLIFIGIDDSIQRCEYGYSVMTDDNTNYFEPAEITAECRDYCIESMTKAANYFGGLDLY